MANVKGTPVETAKNVAAKKVEETKAAVKTAVKAVETKAEEVKAEVKAEAAKAEEKVAAVVKTEAEKVAPAKKEEAPVKKEAAPAKEAKDDKKKPGRKPGSKNKAAKPEKKEVSHPEIFIQFGPGEASVGNVVERIRNEYVEQGHRLSSIKSLKVYLKPEDRSAYYVINDKVAGRVDLF